MAQSFTVTVDQTTNYRSNCTTGSAVAEPTADIEVQVKAGVTPMQLVTALKQLLSHVQENVRTNATSDTS